MSKRSTVVLVGRMNVGKSTLFNRLSSRVKSITLDYEGVTRDTLRDTVSWQGVTFDLVDTGGIHVRKQQDPLFEKVRQQALQMIESAQVVVFVLDGIVGILPEDRELLTYIRKLNKPVIVVVNKIDSTQARENQFEAERLGFNAVVPLSAEHGTGINDLLDTILSLLPVGGPQAVEEPDIRVVFLGRPNVGKSSLMNALLQEERSIVSNIPGTTREAISERITYYQEHIQITDTPGVRRKRSIEGDLEPLMVKSAMHALKNTDIVVMLIDVTESQLVDQELKLAFYAFAEQRKGLIILLNKTDLMTEQIKADLDRSLEYYKHLIDKVPMLQISCVSGKNIGKVLPLIHAVAQKYQQQIPDEEINRLFVSSLQRKPLMHNREFLRVYRAWQQGNSPMTIGIQVNEPTWFGESQLAFFENLLRKEYDLVGVPVRFVLRKNS